MRHLSVIAGLGATVIALAFAATASAESPTTVRIEVDDTLPGDLDCGTFAADHHVFGHVILRQFFRGGELVMELNNFALKHTVTNPATGESLTYPDVGADHFVVKPDGSGILAIIGIVARVVVPGQGMVAGEIGRVELFFTDPADTEPDVSLAGIHSGDEAIGEALCDALAP